MQTLSEIRKNYKVEVPDLLSDPLTIQMETQETFFIDDHIKDFFPNTHSQPLVVFSRGSTQANVPLTIAVLFSGGQASGGHNVITGLFDTIKRIHPESRLIGILNGPSGLIDQNYKELTKDIVDDYRNQGGFDMIGSGRTKIESKEQFEKSLETVKLLEIDGLIIIGGDDSNTNAAHLAEYFLKQGLSTSVIGVPKTIDGDLKNNFIEVSFGFDTATKTFSETISNIARDALSAKKYYFFIKIMGRSASHVALECALQTHPTITLIGEEIAEKNMSLNQIIDDLCDVICKRAESKKEYGVIVIPEGVIEFIPDFRKLIDELNDLLAKETSSKIVENLSKESFYCFNLLPKEIQEQLLLDRDSHGNIQVSKIETERLLMHLVEKELEKRKEKGDYKGNFNPQPLFLGYEGRSGYPSNFDAKYCYSLGITAALLVKEKLTGYMAVIQHLTRPVKEWKAIGVPLVAMMNLEKRKGKVIPVIKKSLVEMTDESTKEFFEKRAAWALEDHFIYTGPIQYAGDYSVTDGVPLTMQIDRSKNS